MLQSEPPIMPGLCIFDAPFLHEVALNPANNLRAQPFDVDTWVVASCCLALCICCSTDINDVDEGIGVSQVVQEAVSKTFAHVRTWHQTSYVEKLNGHRAGSVVTHAIVWFASLDQRFVADVGYTGS